MQQHDFHDKSKPPRLTFQERRARGRLRAARARWLAGEPVSRAELAALAEAGDDTALDELLARQQDDLGRSVVVVLRTGQAAGL